jgi:hypothetical protein
VIPILDVLWKLMSSATAASRLSEPGRAERELVLYGYVSNGATWIAPVTFLNGLTRIHCGLEDKWFCTAIPNGLSPALTLPD